MLLIRITCLLPSHAQLYAMHVRSENPAAGFLVESYVRGASFDAITMDQDAVVYNDDGTITLKFTK